MLQPSQLRYHWYILGSREALKKHFKVSSRVLTRILPEDDTDKYLRGQMVQIGRILCKRCPACGIARELDKFDSDDYRASGCRSICEECICSGRKSKGYNEFQRRKYAAQSAVK